MVGGLGSTFLRGAGGCGCGGGWGIWKVGVDGRERVEGRPCEVDVGLVAEK